MILMIMRMIMLIKNGKDNVDEDNEGGNDDVDDPIFLLPFPGDSSSSPFTACRLHS